MPNPVYKGKLTFQEGGHGWEEIWYTQKYATSKGALDSLAQVAQIRDREGTGANTFLPRIAVSNIAVFGDALPFNRITGALPGGGADLAFSDFASAAWLVRAEASDTLRRQVWLRGMPDRWYSLPVGWQDPDKPPLSPEMMEFLKHYLKQLQLGGWGIYGIDPAAQTQLQQFTGVVREVGTNRLQLRVPAGTIMPAVTEQIRLYGSAITQQPAGNTINSSQRVAAVAGNLITTYQRLTFAPQLPAPANFRILRKAVAVLRKLQPVRPASRITGTVRGISKARRKPRN